MKTRVMLKSWTTNIHTETTMFKLENDPYPLLDDELACDDLQPVIFEIADIRNQTPAE